LILPARQLAGGQDFAKNSLGRGKKEKGFREREFLPRPRLPARP